MEQDLVVNSKEICGSRNSKLREDCLNGQASARCPSRMVAGECTEDARTNRDDGDR